MLTRSGSGTLDNLWPNLAVAAGTDPADDRVVNAAQVDAMGTRTHDATLLSTFTAAFTALFLGLFSGGIPTAANAYLRKILETLGALPAGIGIPTVYEMIRDRNNPNTLLAPVAVAIAPGGAWVDVTPWTSISSLLVLTAYVRNADGAGNALDDARILVTPNPVTEPTGAAAPGVGAVADGVLALLAPPGGLASDVWCKVQAKSTPGVASCRAYLVGKRW